MARLVLILVVMAVLIAIVPTCATSQPEPTPEALIESSPTGAGAAELLEQRPGYLKPPRER